MPDRQSITTPEGIIAHHLSVFVPDRPNWCAMRAYEIAKALREAGMLTDALSQLEGRSDA